MDKRREETMTRIGSGLTVLESRLSDVITRLDHPEVLREREVDFSEE